ncbi:hypothetical protein LTR22_013887 [Elasticomyces elasticus]|nr:hypothetical protein LTR22_013887 [Elasticomyces elasticus]KAK4913842.1 hypothetical protein LTR49_017878 [Elasticomyces elasticus]KAK5752925.1 hypothetical protein LTS12_016997 [Elasticomyces elasticus]
MLRQTWTKVMRAQLATPNHYSSVAVLILHWTEGLDTDLKCYSEVGIKPLKEVLKDGFGFDVRTVKLDNELKCPQVQLDKAIADFVYDHDGHHHSHLLIVYYTGHGFARFDRPHELIISGTARDEAARSDELFAPNANWSQAQRALTGAHADTLVILDCCCAGNVMNGTLHPVNNRSYELMAAVGRDKPATQPGPSSYTHALIKALEELCVAGHVFTTADLHERTSELRTHRGSSHLYSWLPGLQARRIRFPPPAHQQFPQKSKLTPSGGNLSIRIEFDREPFEEPEGFAELALALSMLPSSTGLGICGIEYMDYTSCLPSSSIVQETTEDGQTIDHSPGRSGGPGTPSIIEENPVLT